MTASIDNERTKLAADALDRASTASLAVGIFAPLATLLQEPIHPPVAGVAISLARRLVAALVLHFGARRMIGGLRP